MKEICYIGPFHWDCISLLKFFFYDNLHGVHTLILVLLSFNWFWSRIGVSVKKVRLQVVFASSYPVRFKLCMVVYVDKKMRLCRTCFLWPWGVFKWVLMHFKMGGGGGGDFYSDWLNEISFTWWQNFYHMCKRVNWCVSCLSENLNAGIFQSNV